MAPSARKLPFFLAFALLFFVARADAKPAAHAAKAAPKAAAPAPPASATADEDLASDPSASPPPAPLRWTVGPDKVDLGHDLSMSLPDEDLYLGGADAKTLLEKSGNLQNDNLLGVVVAKDEASDWMVTIRYEEDGYVKDDETLDAAEILKSMREGTEEANKERAAKGFDPLKVDGWREEPHYDKALHHIVWGLDVSDPKGVSVNYSTRVLGRRGWVALNLLSSPEHLLASKPAVAALLSATTFGAGARYEDYVSGKDKLAEYGLTGLVLGGAGVVALKLAKVGLIAKFWNVILGVIIAGKKLAIAAFLGVGAFFKRIFGRKGKAGAETGAAEKV